LLLRFSRFSHFGQHYLYHNTRIITKSSQVIIGNISNKPVIRNTYFFKLNLSSVFPQAISGDILLVNSIARSLGLHDFYTVGLWGYCEGYNDEGITFCSKNTRLYWFNPVEIILNELLAGATISLPAQVVTTLHLVKIASNAMFISFFIGIVFSVVAIFIVPLALYSRWWSFALAIFTFLTALMTTAASLIATVMFSIFKNVLTSQAGLNIGAGLGLQMMVFMWIASAFSLAAFVVHLGLTCCCASRRDVRTGRKRGSNKAYGDALVKNEKKKSGGGRRLWGRDHITEKL
jgi:hypothetical protein